MSEPSPTFSVLMPAYNAAATVEAAIASVLEQTRQDFEIVVVDDGSTDDTAARVSAFTDDPRVRLVRQDNAGLAGARNSAIRASRGRYLSLLDSDDLWLPSYLEAMGGALERNPEAGFAYTDAWAMDERTRRIRRLTAMALQRPPEHAPPDAERLLAELLERNFVFVATTIRREVVGRVGCFRAHLRSSEDYELWLRIAAHGERAVRVPGLHAVYRLRPDSLSQNLEGMYNSLREVFRLVAEEHPVPDHVRARARERMREMEEKLAVLRGERPILERRIAARRALGRLRRRVLDRRLWYASPPPDVARAFPDLRRV